MRRLALALLAALLFTSPAWAVAVGSLTVTPTDGGHLITKYTMAWTCSAGGAVSGNTITIAAGGGHIVQYEFIPGSGGTQPTDLYDVVLNDANAVDILAGGGANLSNSTGKLTIYATPYYYDGQTLDLIVSNAGTSKTGTLILWIAP